MSLLDPTPPEQQPKPAGATGWWHQSCVCVVSGKRGQAGWERLQQGEGIMWVDDRGKEDDRSRRLEMQKQHVVRWEGGVNVKGGSVFVRVDWTQK